MVSVMLYPCMFGVALLMAPFVLCLGVVVILLLNVMKLFI